MVCLGKKNFCLYCENGLTFTEAADIIIREWIKKQPPEIRAFLIGEDNEKK
jgi:hypothetical protein